MKAPFPISSSQDRAMSSSASRAWMTSGRPVSRAAAICVRKPLRLHVARAVIVVIVESGFADRHDLRMAARSATDRCDRDVQLFVRVMRMRADRAPDIGEALGDRADGVSARPGSRS